MQAYITRLFAYRAAVTKLENPIFIGRLAKHVTAGSPFPLAE